MHSLIFLIIATLSSASMAVVLKIFRKQEGNRYGIILGNYLTCTVLAFILMPKDSGIIPDNGITWLCGVIAGALFVLGLLGMQSSVQKNGAILTSAFSKLGLIIPLVISVLFFGENIHLIQIVGILMVFAAIILISFDKDGTFTDRKGKIYPLLLIALLLFCGGGDAMAKIFEQVGRRDQDGEYFLILFVTATILTIGLLLHERLKKGKKVIWKEFAAGILVGIPNYFSSFLLLKSLTGLPAFVVYPSFSAGTLLIVTLIAAIIFKERPGLKAWIGLALIAVSLVLLNIK
ncbi:MAG: DMT family transporter [Clostridia bacterium]|nr:DMT family transporter [Clostridia bacterium]